MEWVETTGRTLHEALEAALDQLGVAESDAEVVVLEEPKSAIFGLRRTEARLRARVRPVQARAKRPNRRAGGSGETRSARRTTPGPAKAPGGGRKPADAEAASEPRAAGSQSSGRRRSRGGTGSRQAPKQKSDAEDRQAGETPRQRAGRGGGQEPVARPESALKEEEMSIESQAELAATFVRGVVEGFGVNATVESSIDDDVIHVRVVGEGLGLLVGPRGATVDALQELTRTAVQHRSDEHAGRIHVDVAGYRARRAAALQEFARRVAEQVVSSGRPQALEAMNAVDRKVVHDAVADVSGAATTSEGEDPHRHVVIRPVAGDSDGAATDSPAPVETDDELSNAD